jgi:hypothetical protein
MPPDTLRGEFVVERVVAVWIENRETGFLT